MILSRTIAKQRMAAGVRPSFVSAWGLVLVDLALVALIAFLTWGPFDQWFRLHEPNVGLVIGLIFVLFFLPSQFFLILSALWAAKSRWADSDPEH